MENWTLNQLRLQFKSLNQINFVIFNKVDIIIKNCFGLLTNKMKNKQRTI